MQRQVLLVLLVAYCVFAVIPSTTRQTEIVSLHNQKRGSVTPAASPALVNLQWNSTLATIASNYAGQCLGFFHNSNNGGTGENIAAFTYLLGDTKLSDSITMWDAERSDFTLSSNTCKSGKVCGHYTQIAWDTTTQVGCGYADCSRNSPWGSGYSGQWTYVVCNYYPPGNYPRAPYTAGSGSGSCTPTCPVNSCGTQSSCGQSISCSCGSNQYCNSGTCAACTNPCTAGKCGLVASSTCPTVNFDCGSCGSGQICSSNVCAAPPASCNPTTECAAIGKVCGTWSTTNCPSLSCGSCTGSNICQQSGQACIAPTCNNACSSPSQTCDTASNTCKCTSGYTLVNNVCTIVSSGTPNWATDYSVILGSGALTFPSNQLSVSGSNSAPTLIKFNRSGFINPFNSKLTVEAIVSRGSFGLGFRVAQSATGSAAADGFFIFFENIGTSTQGLRYDRRTNGSWRNPAPSLWSLPLPWWNTAGVTTLTARLTTNDTGSGQTTISLDTNAAGYTASYAYTTTENSLPNLGSAGIYVKTVSGSSAIIQKLTLSTSTTLQVSLFSCITDTAWATMFTQITGATSVTVRATGENARCKAAGAKEAASAFIVVIESSTVSTEAIASNFVAAVNSGSAAVAPLAVSSAAIVPGTQGAILAGVVPTAAIVDPIAAGGAGAGAGGLSGGAIAGIVVGSVAGAVLVVGITAVVVAAVVVAAVVVAKNSGSDEEESSGPNRSQDPKRGSIRNTIYNIFRAPRGGVDVMNNPSGHQSITARAPPMH